MGKLGMGKIPVPPREAPFEPPMRGRSPSLHDTHDDMVPPEDRFELVLACQAALEVRIARLEKVLIGSSPPGAVEVKGPLGWSGRAPKGTAVLLAVIIALTVLRDEIGKLLVLLFGK